MFFDSKAFVTRGFAPDTLAGLVPAGLATVVTETVRARFLTIIIHRSQITDAGQRAITEVAPLNTGQRPSSRRGAEESSRFPFRLGVFC
jgi:hypothetical protein